MTDNTDQMLSSRDLLFGDMPLNDWAEIENTGMSWDLFKQAKQHVNVGNIPAAIETLMQVTALPGLESRQYLQAYHCINELQAPVTGDIKIFAVVLELSMPDGHDMVAVYADHSARYFNYAGKIIFWEQPDNSLDEMIDDIFMQSIGIVAKIGPWKAARPEPIGHQIARINFLTSHGLHFGEAPQRILFHDPMAGKIMFAMLDVAKALIDKSQLS